MGSRKDMQWRPPLKAARWTAGAIVAGMLLATPGAAKNFGPWGTPVNAEDLDGSSDLINTQWTDGCPIMSPYDGSLYMASDRQLPGAQGGLDIWIAPRSGDGWGEPVNAGETINSGGAEFCPTPARGNRFFFVKRISASDTDIYVVKKLPTGWGEPEMLPKGPGQINSDAEEWSPSWYEAPDGTEVLYFSSTRDSSTGPASPAAKHDIFYSVDFGAAQLAAGVVNTDDPAFSDARPNVRHDGLEIVFDSTRQGGAPDLYTASRSSVSAPWGNLQHLTTGATEINSSAAESRGSFSWDGTMLLFGSTRAGSTDIYVSYRDKLTGRR